MREELQKYIDTIPAVKDVSQLRETFWNNDKKIPDAEQENTMLRPEQIEDARKRLERFAPYLEEVFPELRETHGVIESELREIPGMKDFLNTAYGAGIEGRLMLKMDSHLPISGSVKARGGIYEVLKHAEDLALKAGLLSETDNYRVLAGPKCREFFGKHSDTDETSYFVDDENSRNLFLGYSVAGKRLQKQLEEQKIAVDSEHPLFVYIPCGIGGAPGGVTYGLKQIYGDNVHCFFTEPVHACCMLLGMATGLQDQVSVRDLGIDGRTDADGLAVGRPSAFVGRVVEPMLSGIATIEDKKLYDLMRGLLDREEIFIEPSACASFAALIRPEDLRGYVEKEGLAEKMKHATHIAWATGGNMVPEETRRAYLSMGLA